jgi:CHAT domain
MEMVNREKEMIIAEELLGEIANHSETPEQCIVEFVGLAGSGKTTLLRKIRQTAVRYPPCGMFYVDFAGIQYKNATPYEIKVMLGQCWFEQFQPDMASIDTLIDTLQEKLKLCSDFASEPEKGEEHIKAFFMQLISTVILSSSYKMKLLFMLDAFDKVSESLTSWFEQTILLLLLKNRKDVAFGFIIASRHSIEWENHDTKRSRSEINLEPLSEADTIRQVEYLVTPNIGSRIYETTNGSPLLNQYVAKRVREFAEDEDNQLNEFNFGFYEARLIREMVSAVLEPHIMRVSLDLTDIFRCMSIASFFDVDLLQQILMDYFPKTHRSRASLRRIQEEMTNPRSNLARWEPDTGAFVIDPVIRKALSLDTRLNNRAMYRQIAQTVIAIMRSWIDNNFKTSQAFCEILFQQANIISMNDKKSSNDILEYLKDILNKFLIEKCKSKFGLKIAEELKDKINKFKELESRLGRKHIDDLSNAIEDFIVQEVAEQDRASQKASLEIHKGESTDTTDVYYVSLTLSGEAKGASDTIPVPIQIRRGLMRKLSATLDQEALIEIGRVLFTTFLPENVKRRLFSSKIPISIICDDNDLPWELIYEEPKFLCRENHISRVSSSQEHTQAPPATYTRPKHILLIANPTGDLRETEEEVDQISLLAQQARFIPTTLRREDASVYRINLELSKGIYTIIHYAGHMNFDKDTWENSGLVLSDGLYPASNIRASLTGNPFVFLNACFSGKSERVESRTWRWGTQTLGLASAFIDKGSIGYIGNLWLLPDGDAYKFAVSFYTSVFQGFTIAHAMKNARVSFTEEKLSWASYIMYGDPIQHLINQAL